MAVRRDVRHRGWRVVGIGVALWGAGQVVWTWEEVVAHRHPFPGVADIDSLGGYEKQYVVAPSLERLSAHGLSLADVVMILLPDEFLARNVARQTSVKIIAWQGKCMVHEQYTGKDILDYRKQFDDLLVIAHPECDTDVTSVADFSGSTSQMEQFIRQNKQKNAFHRDSRHSASRRRNRGRDGRGAEPDFKIKPQPCAGY